MRARNRTTTQVLFGAKKAWVMAQTTSQFPAIAFNTSYFAGLADRWKVAQEKLLRRRAVCPWRANES